MKRPRPRHHRTGSAWNRSILNLIPSGWVRLSRWPRSTGGYRSGGEPAHSVAIHHFRHRPDHGGLGLASFRSRAMEGNAREGARMLRSTNPWVESLPSRTAQNITTFSITKAPTGKGSRSYDFIHNPFAGMVRRASASPAQHGEVPYSGGSSVWGNLLTRYGNQ
jgi:hypothetical protein